MDSGPKHAARSLETELKCDGYLRLTVAYALDDRWELIAGANLFAGRLPHTFFGQFENDSNVCGALEYAR